MELPSLNLQCNQKDCNKIDFLPLQCKCGKVFCSRHFNAHVQSCEKSRFLSEDELKKIETLFLCSHSDCKEKSIVPLICERCKKHFCIKHRHLQECSVKDPETLAAEKEKYAAPVRQFTDVKASIDKELDNKIAMAKSKGKHKDVAYKVQLMRLKNKASGLKTIPISDRLYFNVTHPNKLNKEVTPIFVSREWSLGRAIDAIAHELKLVNNNNKTNEKKLRLFKTDGNDIVSNNMSIKVNSLLDDEVVVNGEDLILEYVDNDCLKLV